MGRNPLIILPSFFRYQDLTPVITGRYHQLDAKEEKAIKSVARDPIDDGRGMKDDRQMRTHYGEFLQG